MMPDAVERFTHMKAKVYTQTLVFNGVPLCFIDVETPDGMPNVSIGWDPAWRRFGVYVDGEEVWPPVDNDENIGTVAETVDEGE